VEDIQIFIDTNKPNDDSYNKYLYTLRPLFRFARDIKKALPALLPTECDLLVYHKPGKVDKKVFTVEAYGKLLNAAPDKETLLALKLVFRHHVREDECADLLGEDFRKNEKGFPIELIIREEVSKTGIVRKIPIDEDHRAVLKELIPDSGRLFTTKDPYFRVRQLAKRIGIPWVNRGPRRSCTSYCVYSGIDIVKVAERNGHTETVLRNRYLVAVSHSQSKLFCSIRISLDKIKRLPSHFNGRNNSRKRKAKKVAPAPAILAA
jgi:integrase